MLKTPLPEQEIINLLNANYGIEIESAQLLQLGADMNALVYKANSKSKSYFVKIKFGNHEETHIAILQLLHNANLTEIIFPHTTTNGKLFKQLDHFKMLVYPFIEGKNGFEQPLTKNQWIELGTALKKIHTLPVPDSILKQLRKENFSTYWREAVRSLYSLIKLNSTDDHVTISFKKFFKTKLKTITQLVNSAEELSKNIQPHLNQYVLCHSDLHAGNILIPSEEAFYIVDWDDPIMAPKERDLMFIGGGVGNVWNSPNEIDYFYEGYGEVGIDKKMLAYYRKERIIEDIALFSQDVISSNLDEPTKLISFNHFKAMFEPNGVIDVAR